jgi:demethylmenaquinone methyltransferase / 2-methoxy-6-polyprenyl-1,4-benzoquinol methylase
LVNQISGTTPPGAATEKQAALWVRDMFAGVAPKYDFLNHLLSFNIDRSWRRHLTRALQPVLARPDARILDLCCGTGDVLLDLQRLSASKVYGADFCHPMLVSARKKAPASPLFEADALQLPLADNSLDAISIAFGFRNLANYANGLRELQRVLKPGGTLAILEFSHPQGLLVKASYGVYMRVLLPLIGGMVSGSRSAYTYLPESIRKFPDAELLRDLMVEAGFEGTRFQLLSGGISALHVADKPAQLSYSE